MKCSHIQCAAEKHTAIKAAQQITFYIIIIIIIFFTITIIKIISSQIALTDSSHNSWHWKGMYKASEDEGDQSKDGLM